MLMISLLSSTETLDSSTAMAGAPTVRSWRTAAVSGRVGEPRNRCESCTCMMSASRWLRSRKGTCARSHTRIPEAPAGKTAGAFPGEIEAHFAMANAAASASACINPAVRWVEDYHAQNRMRGNFRGRLSTGRILNRNLGRSRGDERHRKRNSAQEQDESEDGEFFI